MLAEPIVRVVVAEVVEATDAPVPVTVQFLNCIPVTGVATISNMVPPATADPLVTGVPEFVTATLPEAEGSTEYDKTGVYLYN